MGQSSQEKVIILTGASGFVGAAVLKQVLKDGNLPLVLQRPSSNPFRLKDLEGYPTFVYQSLTDEQLIEKIKDYQPQILINLAWRGVAGKDRNELHQIQNNLPLTLQSVELAKSVGCSQWIGIGSQAEYGNPNRQVDEQFPTYPTTLYGKAKLAACWAALGLCQAYDIQGSWIRLFDPYGPGDDSYWLIPYLIREIASGNSPKLTKCEQLWDYLYVEDAAKAILSVAYTQATGIFNLGSGVAIPLKEVVETLKNFVNPTIQPEYGAVPYRPDQVMHLQADITRIKTLTGWEPKITIEQGLLETVKGILKQ